MTEHADGCSCSTAHSVEWVEGHKAGYAKGRDDGIGIGFSDAKLRAYNAIDVLATRGERPMTPTTVKEALAQTLGRQV